MAQQPWDRPLGHRLGETVIVLALLPVVPLLIWIATRPTTGDDHDN